MSIQTTQIKLLASALGLNRADIAEIIALGGVTVSKSRVDSWLRSNGEETRDEDIARLSPLMHGHINMLGHYTFTLPEDILKGELRTFNYNINNELSS